MYRCPDWKWCIEVGVLPKLYAVLCGLPPFVKDIYGYMVGICKICWLITKAINFTVNTSWNKSVAKIQVPF